MTKFTVAKRDKVGSHEAKKAKAPQVGLFFVVNGKPWVEGLSWTENLSAAGFRTHNLGHPEYWEQLQGIGAVPRDMAYDMVARGRANYEETSRRFTLFADRCILRNKRLVSSIMSKLCLPRGTRVLAD